MKKRFCENKNKIKREFNIYFDVELIELNEKFSLGRITQFLVIYTAIFLLIMTSFSSVAFADDISSSGNFHMNFKDNIMFKFNQFIYGKSIYPDVNEKAIDTYSLNEKTNYLITIYNGTEQILKKEFPNANFTKISNIDNKTEIYEISINSNQVMPKGLWNALLTKIHGNKSKYLAFNPYVKELSIIHRYSIDDVKYFSNMPKSQYIIKPNNAGVPIYKILQHYGIVNLTYNGNGIKLAVLDTGLDTDAIGKYFNKNKTFAYSVIYGTSPKDNVGHGTFVCSEIALQYTEYNGYIFRGVAPNITLYSIKVMDSHSGDETSLIRGIEKAIQLKVDIISMSLGGKIPPFTPLYSEIQKALADGIIIVSASGNEQEQFSDAPACWDGVISVGAFTIDNYIAFYSNLGADVYAVGTNVYTFGYYYLDGTFKPLTMSGTSMATPLVSGMIALFLQAHPEYIGKPYEVKNLLREYGDYNNPIKPLKLVSLDLFNVNNYYYATPEISITNLIKMQKQDKSILNGRNPMYDSSIQFYRTWVGIEA